MQHLDPFFSSLAFILVIASVITIIFKKLKQPVVLGYVVAGVITTLLPLEPNKETISLWGEIGVIFLLFTLGLEFSFKKLKKVGGSGAIAATTEAVIMMSTGLLIGKIMGFTLVSSLFLGGMLSISSTSIIVKCFEEMRLKNRSSSQIVLGVLVIEDIIAILLLVLLASIAVGSAVEGEKLMIEVGKLGMFLIFWFTGGISLVPTLFRKLKKWLVGETLLIVALGLCFLSVIASVKVGFSPALGAFLMGAIVAETDQSEQIHKQITPLRNLFAAVFFISVGMLVDLTVIYEHITTVLLIISAILIIKPLSAILGILFSGKSLKLAMVSGLTLAQIGEFSFIIAGLGIESNVISPSLYPIIVVVSILTTITTPIYIKNSEKLYNKLFSIIPQTWRSLVMHYGSGSSTLNRENEWHTLLKTYIFRFVIHATWMSVIVLLSFNVLTPYVYSYFGEEWWITLSLTVVTLLLLSPFLYNLAVKRSSVEAFNKLWDDKKYSRAPLMMLILLRFIIAGIFVAIVVGKFYSARLVVIIPSAIIVVGAVVMSRNLKGYYQLVESHFLKNLDKTSRSSGISIPSEISHNIHMEYFDIHLGSFLISKTISEIHRGFKTGINVVTILRNGCRLDLPQKTEQFNAGDRVLVIGDDNQIDKFRAVVEMSSIENSFCSFAYDINLYQVTLTQTSLLCGKMAHVSTIINSYKLLLIGYENEESGFLRPNPRYQLREGDTVWIVGEKENAKNVI